MDRKRRSIAALLAVLCLATVAGCEMFARDFGEIVAARIRSMEERAGQRDAIADLRLDTLLPGIMERHDVDCWLIVTAGARPDPLTRIVAPAAARDAGRAHLLLCPDPEGESVEVAIGEGTGAVEGLAGTWDRVLEAEDRDTAGELLRRELREAEPERVAWNRSLSWPLADGLSAGDRGWLEGTFGSRPGWEWVSSAPLVRDLLHRHLDVEVPLFAEAAARTADVLELVLRSEVIRPGKSSLDEIRWAVRQNAADLGLAATGPIGIDLLRPGGGPDPAAPRYMESWPMPGDLIFVTAGVDYLGYAPRMGRWAYVSRRDELAPPAQIVAGLEGLVEVLERVGPGILPGISREEAEAMLVEALGGDAGVDARLTPLGAYPPEWWVGDDVEAADFEIRRDSFYAVELSWLLELEGWSEPAPLRILEATVATEEGLRTVVEPDVGPAFIE